MLLYSITNENEINKSFEERFLCQDILSEFRSMFKQLKGPCIMRSVQFFYDFPQNIMYMHKTKYIILSG